MTNDIYSVTDLQKYAESIRKNAALSFAEYADENLDEFISIGQVINIIIDRYIICMIMSSSKISPGASPAHM